MQIGRRNGAFRHFAAFLFLLWAPLPAAAAEPVTDVLFVGNSFSFYNNGIHNHYKKLVASSGDSVRTRLTAISGAHLEWHVASVQMLVQEEQWDVVVLQGHSRGPIGKNTARSFRSSARELADIVRDGGARPVFFMTWAYADQPDMTDDLANAYQDIAKQLDADVIPVGLAFEMALKLRPDLELTMDDLKHPTLAGTYLASCVLYAGLRDTSPEGLDYTAGLTQREALFLQQVAWDTVNHPDPS